MLSIRNASLKDLDEINALEQSCFTEDQAASRDTLKKRLEIYPNHFWLLERDGKLVSMVNGMVIDDDSMKDAMYEDANIHKEDGKWQLLFGVETAPEYRKKGYASILMKEVIKDCENDFRKGILLNCPASQVDFYKKLGFEHLGIADSRHAGQEWHKMQYKIASSE